MQTSRAVKSASRETTFPTDIDDPTALLGALVQLADRLAEDLARKELAGRTIGIKVRLADWSTITRAHTIEAPTNDAEVVRSIARELLEREQITAPVRLLGVRCAGFDEPTPASVRSAANPAQLELPLDA